MLNFTNTPTMLAFLSNVEIAPTRRLWNGIGHPRLDRAFNLGLNSGARAELKIQTMELTTILLLVLCLGVALAFEFVNGFHDTANAVATVIYTNSLKPWAAVIWSGFVNFLGTLSVLTAGAAVAFKIVNLLPTDLLAGVHGPSGVWMILSILVTAVIWNVGTWYFGIPSSSSHTLIGSILGVGLAAGYLHGKGLGGLNAAKTFETLQWLLISPLIGFFVAGLLLWLVKKLIANPALHRSPDGDAPPPWPVRLLLIGTCTGVSYAHGSNDGQKGIGLVMLILIALLPSQFTVNPAWRGAEIQKAVAAIQKAEPILASARFDDAALAEKSGDAQTRLGRIEAALGGKESLTALSPEEQVALRTDVLTANADLKKVAADKGISKDDAKTLDSAMKVLSPSVEFATWWVIAMVAVALGLGTTIGWKRVVVTVGEKIGKSHMTYAQGACAELVAMCTILYATYSGAPVSTTHVVSSGIAGTMAASGAGVQPATLQKILLAWVLTLPVTMVISALLFLLTAGRYLPK